MLFIVYCVYGFLFTSLFASPVRVQPSTMDMLFSLAERGGVEAKKAAMVAGDHINSTENRAVMHTALRVPREGGRGGGGVKMNVDGVDVVPQVHEVLDRIKEFCSQVSQSVSQ